MRRPGGKVAILGGGMAGLSTAWRLSEPGWRDRFESITVYQRGWRLGGKGASSRGVNDRIEEHGLHVWLGSYENAFALLRECYAELDRPATDPSSPIRTWQEAIVPADNPGLAEQWGTGWLTWLGTHPRNGMTPGEPGGTGQEITVVEFVQRAVQLVVAFADSLRDAAPADLQLTATAEQAPAAPPPVVGAVQRGILAALLAIADPQVRAGPPGKAIEQAVDAVRAVIDYEERPDHRRSWLLISLVVAAVRGVVADNLINHPNGFRAINDEEFGDWVLRHGGHPDVLESAFVRGLYDLVFGYDHGDPRRPAVGAGVMVFLIGFVLFGYKGAIFWKMTAGMGDVVMAPLYQALRRRGVKFEFFHRLDSLHVDDLGVAIDAITLGRQVRLADGVGHYDPLVDVRGLAVFPSAPRGDQIQARSGMRTLESHFAARDDVETVVLQRGKDFDHIVLAVSVGMIPVVAAELIEDRPEWREMTANLRTVATQAFQLWLRPDEHALGWSKPGATITAYARPFETWASMPQTLWAENWLDPDRPGAVAYFCGSLRAPWPVNGDHPDYVRRYRDLVHRDAADYVDRYLGLYFPNAVSEQGFKWELLCGNDGRRGAAAMATQHVSVNIDPSDRYVQSVPGSDKYRLRPDESGYDNLILAGDWTDCGLNAGCIEAAVMSGFEAANALLGHGRYHRIRGFYLR
ncbi:amine oxidase [Mycolicibacterium conceptionense]|uniref:Amine oxidase n=2 Tax=Mycolicibacterium TaxID=1866885 RepID=A0ABR5FT70_9MYCO|nr:MULTISPECIES: FAD-dependent oxidoreductase [Mycolicibacterium]KLI06108.1 amine oxidase [Mycolicibacterium senegalense]KLO51148.1 amine oxidase [Mycolicibacterium senegalense]KMV15339.1 amine oxidase [Mycolicibacterium conceptionense]OBK01674.1 amine oxidase [Mycolicibacterium conceptionense]OMB91671.1 amine oxidase [Mycolicibacterium conceptionense]